jgi:hypothetical protein
MRRFLPAVFLASIACGSPPSAQVPVAVEPYPDPPSVVVDNPPPVVVDPPADTPLAIATSGMDPRDARQLYCNGTCSWAGPQNCDQADADVFCKLKMRNVNAHALRFRVGLPLAEGGYACAEAPWGHSIGRFTAAGINDVRFEDNDVLKTHGAGQVVYDVECADGTILAR